MERLGEADSEREVREGEREIVKSYSIQLLLNTCGEYGRLCGEALGRAVAKVKGAQISFHLRQRTGSAEDHKWLLD